MDISKLTPEDRNVLTALVRSPGWALLMEKLFIPQMQLATHFLDRPQAEQSGKADYLRGIKASYANLIDMVYHVAGIENPLQRHAAGLLASVRNTAVNEHVQRSVSGDRDVGGLKDAPREERGQRTRARSYFPV